MITSLIANLAALPTISEIIIYIAFGAGGLALGAVGSLGIFLWKASSRWSEMNSRISKIEDDSEKVDQIPILIEKMDQLIQRIDKLTESHEKIRENFIDSKTCDDRWGEINRRLNKLED